MKQTAVRLPDETYARLQDMASKTGRTATFYIREAIDAYLDDLEDIYLAERALDEIQQGKARTYSLEELKRLSKEDAARIAEFLEQRLLATENPRGLGAPLKGSRFEHLWRYRVGDHRIVCDIQDHRVVVLVLNVGHRREVYR